ncbi:MAG: hypothetical protein JSW45_04370, partial [Thiotrichales bacterium]
MANTFDLILWTDKLDYAPGDTATFTVEGVTIGGTVEFQVLHVTDPGDDGVYGTLDDTLDAGPDGILGTADDGYGTTGEGHDSFYVTDGVYEIDAGADGIEGTADDIIIGDQDMTANGIIVTDWYVNPDDSLNEIFLLTAEEVQAGTDGQFGTADDVYTGSVGTTSFTDGAVSLSQWAEDSNPNPDWIGGNVNEQKASLVEGDFLPYRQVFSGLEIGATYYFGMNWDVAAGGLQAIDYIGTYNATIANDPTQGTSLDNDAADFLNAPVPTDTFAIPLDPILTGTMSSAEGTFSFSGTQEAGFLTMWGGDIISVGTYSNDGSLNIADEFEQSLEYAFVAQSSEVVLAWGGHIGIRSEWGSNDRPTGSPYHTSNGTKDGPQSGVITAGFTGPRTSETSLYGDVPDPGTDTDDNIGRGDVQLQASAVVGLPSITVIKDAIPVNDPQDFEFLATNLEPTTFSLDDDNDGTLSNTQEFIDVPLSIDANGIIVGPTYTIEEINIPTFWEISDIQVSVIDLFGGAIDTVFYIGDELSPGYDPGDTKVFIQAAGDEDITITFVNDKPFVPNPAYTITKTVTDVDGAGSTGSVDAAGDVISYQIEVANTGNTFIDGVVVTDQVESGTVDTLTLVSGDADSDGRLDADETIDGVDTDSDGKLDLGETWIYNDTYTVQQSDMDNNGGGDGDIDNTATVSSNQLA